MVDRRLLSHFDWGLFTITFLICLVGLILLYSAIHVDDAASQISIFYKQLVWIGLGFGIMACVSGFHYKHLDKWAPVIYTISLVLLICVHFFGRHAGGSTRWLVLGPLNLQPSEPVKIAVIIILARYFAHNAQKTGLTFRELLTPMVLVSIPFFLVATQPDLGTAGTILLIAAAMTVFTKVERKTFIVLSMVVVLAIPAGWKILEPYQKERLHTLLSPESDPLGAGYHIRQSKIAVGSGQVFGKGYLEGTQKKLSFLPEQHTDFIFSVLAEEWGFAGSVLVLFMFLLLIAFAVNIASGCRDAFGTILCVGIAAMIFLQVFVNMAMVMGLMPVVGMPLPLVSYGGSSIFTIFLGIGLLMNVSIRRYVKQ